MTAELKSFKDNSGGYNRSDEICIEKATKVYEQGRYPVVGDQAIPFTLPNVNNENISLESLLVKGPVILSFFRGGWCNYCQIELKALQRSMPEFEKLNASLVGISPSVISVKDITQGQITVSYAVLSDIGNSVAENYGLRFQMTKELVDIFDGFGLDMEEIHAVSGDESENLPIPATFVIDQNMNIVFSFVDPDHTKRADPTEIIAALMSIT